MIWLMLACGLYGSVDENSRRDQPALIADMDQDARAFYRRFQSAETPRQKANAVLDLCQLHNLIWCDPRYDSIQKLRGMRNQVVFQLKAAQKSIRKEAGIPSRPAAQRNATSENHADSMGEEHERQYELSERLLESLIVGLRYTPGPDQLAVHAGSFGGADSAPELIALIESTIHPEHWNFNGGPGHIQYYRPVMALVVRAGSVVHEDMTDFLQRLRELGQ